MVYMMVLCAHQENNVSKFKHDQTIFSSRIQSLFQGGFNNIPLQCILISISNGNGKLSILKTSKRVDSAAQAWHRTRDLSNPQNSSVMMECARARCEDHAASADAASPAPAPVPLAGQKG